MGREKIRDETSLLTCGRILYDAMTGGGSAAMHVLEGKL